MRIANTDAASYVLSIQGDPNGREGAASHFEGRVLIMGDSGPQYTSLTMRDALAGSATVAVTENDSELFLIVASVPEHFSGNQTYGYAYRIDRK